MNKGLKIIGIGLLIGLGTRGISYTSGFKDISNSWARVPIEKAVERGIMQGYNGYIKPDKKLTRAEMAVMINKILDLEAKVDLSKYDDVDKESWYYDSLSGLIGAGLLEISGESLNPNEEVTREEVFTVVAKIMQIQNDKPNKRFKDHEDITNSNKPYVYGLVGAGLLKGYDDNTLRPKNEISRGEFAQVLDMTYNLLLSQKNRIEAEEKSDIKTINYKILSSNPGDSSRSEGMDYYENGDKVIVNISMEFTSSGYSLSIEKILKDGKDIVIRPKVTSPKEGSYNLTVLSYETVSIEMDRKDLGEDYNIIVEGLRETGRDGETFLRTR